MLEKLKQLWRANYVRLLEEEVSRLRGENRADEFAAGDGGISADGVSGGAQATAASADAEALLASVASLARERC